MAQRRKPRPRGRRTGKLFALLVGIPAAILLLIAILNWVVMPLYTRLGREIDTPDVTGLAREEAEKVLARFNLKLGEVRVVADTLQPPGRVVTQFPPPGRKVKAGRTVALDVSRGSDRVLVPDLGGLRLEEAIAAVTAAGLRVGEVESLRTPDFVPGLIIAVRPMPGTELDRNATIIIAVSAPAGKFPMPNLTGMNIETASGIVASQGLILTPVRDAPSDEPVGMVMFQYPEEGTPVADGDTVALIVASPVEPAPDEQ
ncbi:MAG TPA: PASTA domain-containing protein [candidate division WOR-3 bacterium]|uniref:PASTA domain-containing protein n=1 Tax=candidate division WOR-3 bacterium TaxID=2052148 RepID=A0A7V0XFE5_UNCW3|nr:PASTA domain-containing protein [candidate division WOR-3 bacterium]